MIIYIIICNVLWNYDIRDISVIYKSNWEAFVYFWIVIRVSQVRYSDLDLELDFSFSLESYCTRDFTLVIVIQLITYIFL